MIDSSESLDGLQLLVECSADIDDFQLGHERGTALLIAPPGVKGLRIVVELRREMRVDAEFLERRHEVFERGGVPRLRAAMRNLDAFVTLWHLHNTGNLDGRPQ